MKITTEQIGAEIVAQALRFVGLYEKRSNAEWDDPTTAGPDTRADELHQLLLATGWRDGWAYCAAFCKVVWRQAHIRMGAPDALLHLLGAGLTPSVMNTYRNFETGPERGWPFRVTKEAMPGSIFLMQLGAQWRGHAGIVVDQVGAKMRTIEGNTSPDPGTAEADREGDGVFRRVRTIDFTEKPGLWLRGFLNPVEFDGQPLEIRPDHQATTA